MYQALGRCFMSMISLRPHNPVMWIVVIPLSQMVKLSLRVVL